MIGFIIKYVKKFDQLLVGLTMKLIPFRYGTKNVIHPKHLFDQDRNNYLRDVINRLNKTGFEFLDLGCGAGSDLLLAIRNGATKVVGIEYLESSRLIATQRLEDIDANFDVLNVDLENALLPIENQSIDLVNFTNVLEHLHNRENVLKEMSRVMTADGLAVVSIPNQDTPWKKLQRRYGIDSRDDTDHKVEYSKETIQIELAAAGLQIVSPYEVIVPSLPIHGILCLLSLIGPKPYIAGQNFKRRFVLKNTKHSIGWIFLVQKTTA